MYKKLIFITIIIIINGLTNTTALNLLVALPQFLIVLYYMYSEKIEKAIFWHFIFMITSFTYYGDADTLGSGLSLESYNYAKLKIVGPVGYSQIVSIVLFGSVLLGKYTKKIEIGPFRQFYRLIGYFLMTGLGLGLVGFLFDHYYVEGLKTYGSYIIIIYIHTFILYRINNDNLRKDLFDIITPLLVLFPICTFILKLIDPELVGGTAAGFYSMLLIPALLFNKKILFVLVGLFFVIYNSVFFSTSGKGLLLLVLYILFTFLLTYSKNIKSLFPRRAKIFRLLGSTFFILLPTTIYYITKQLGGSALLSSKIWQVRTLIEGVFLGQGLDLIANSPYIRITSLINIMYEGLSDPIMLLFGKGYGGYFNDHFNYFSGLDLSRGAFSDIEIMLGDYYSGHDTIVTVPMLNGIVGFYLLLKVLIKYLKLSGKNYIALSAIPFLMLSFYFDTIIGVTGVLLLFVSTHSVIERGK